MKRICFIRPGVSLAALVTLAGGMVIASPTPVFSQAVQLLEVDVKVLGKGYRASKLMGQHVYNDKNEKIGEIDDIVIDRDHVLFAVLEVGGFLGIGGRLIAVTPESLAVEESGSKLKIKLAGASRDAVENSKEFKYPMQQPKTTEPEKLKK